jgi:Ser/Thr protein kinase RdoA (MazF antagonist)
MGTGLEAPTWPAITAVEAEAALARFPAAGSMTGLRWHSPRPFSAAALVHTTQGAFVLKRHHRHVRSPAGLAEEHGFIAHLARRIPVAEVMTATDGSGAVTTGEWTYELHRQAPGIDLYRDRASWTPFMSDGHAHAAGVALAQLHRASRGYDAPRRANQPLVASFAILPADDPVAAVEAYIAARPALAAFVAERPWRRQMAALFGVSAAGLAARLAAAPPLWTHNDWHPSNLLWDRDGTVRTVIDFGLADRTCALHDLATAIERTAIGWLRLGQANDDDVADAETALALIAGYATLLPLGGDDLDTLVRLLPLVHVEFALSEVEYFAGVIDDPAAAALAWDGYLIGHAAWFRSAPGRELLRRIGQGA